MNEMLIKMLQEEGNEVNVCSSELLQHRILFKLKKWFPGLNRMLANHYARHFAQKTDIVICNGEFSYGVRAAAAINVFHGSYYGYGRAIRPYISNRQYMHLMRLSEQQVEGAKDKIVVSVSSYLKTILESQGIDVHFIINNAIDTEMFRPPANAQRNTRCLFVGAMDYYGKGVDVLERLAEAGVEIDCITAQRPPHDKLNWLGNVPNEKLVDYYQRYKMLILPSRFESCGLVALEAMSCGTPVIMSSVGIGPELALEIPEFVVDGPWETLHQRIAERIDSIESNWTEFSLRGRSYVLDNHGYAQWKKKWMEVMDAMLGRIKQSIHKDLN